MPDIRMTLDDSTAQAILSRAPGVVGVALRGAVEDGTTYVLYKIRRYPPQRPGSSYRRTNTLKRSWSRRIEGRGLEIRGIVASNGAMAPYNRTVQSRPHQARVHRGRWHTAQSVSEAAQPVVQRMVMNRLRAAGL